MRRKILVSLLLLGAQKLMALESPAFDVEKSEGDFELRRYPAYLVAEVRVDGPFEDAGSKGFRKLADFIFGKNKSQSKIAMTAPVGQVSSESEKIAMTAPVGLQETAGRYLISFTMPSSYTSETLPLPIDPEVQIREIKEHRAAVLRYSGFWSQERFQAKSQELLSWMESQNLAAEGEPVFARYNPPWMPWFLRRNEVIWTVNRIP